MTRSWPVGWCYQAQAYLEIGRNVVYITSFDAPYQSQSPSPPRGTLIYRAPIRCSPASHLRCMAASASMPPALAPTYAAAYLHHRTNVIRRFHFCEMVQSVVAQSCRELILVDDASTNETTSSGDYLRPSCDWQRSFAILFDKNRHIAGATNHGIAQATGEYIALLDHDDILHPDALVGCTRSTVLVRSLLTPMRRRWMNMAGPYQPFFKPD